MKKTKTIVILALFLALLPSVTARAGQVYFSAEDLEGKRVGVAKGYGADLTVTEMGIFRVSRYLYDVDLPVALKAGNIEAFATERSSAELMAAEIPGLVILPEPIGHEKYVAVSSKRNKALGEAVDAAIGEIIGSPAYAEMIERWLGGNAQSAVMPDIPAGRGERLVVGVSSDYMPFEYFGEGGERLGFDVELILRIGALLDREIVFFETAHSSLFPALDSGYADVCISVIDDKPVLREKYFVSRPYYDNVVMLVVQAERGKAIGFMDGIARSINNHLIVEKRFMYIIEGLCNTLIITGAAAFCGTLLGALLCAAIRGKRRFLRGAALLYVRILQGTPIIVLLLFTTYVMFAGSGLDTVLTGTVAFSLYFSVKVSEVFRAGLDAIENGQIEAARALGLSGLQTYRLVLIPQAAIMTLPLYSADLVEMLKLTSVVGYVGIMDLTYSLEIIRSRTYEAVFPLALETLLYIFLTSSVTRIFRVVSARIDPAQKMQKERRIII
ncbi:MAG: ABC transporter substrate-binding protein/permease [Synergistaceae bacterium]|nr:ABC transporter substrate-binding protein/permease [Synergistaceae bacterium]